MKAMDEIRLLIVFKVRTNQRLYLVRILNN